MEAEMRLVSEGAEGLGALAVEERERLRSAVGIEDEESEEQEEEREECAGDFVDRPKTVIVRVGDAEISSKIGWIVVALMKCGEKREMEILNQK